MGRRRPAPSIVDPGESRKGPCPWRWPSAYDPGESRKGPCPWRWPGAYVSAANPLAHVGRRDRAPSSHGEVKARALLDLLWLVEPRERKVLILVGEGEQVSEVARSLGVPIGTAFSWLRRGRGRLAAALGRWRPLR
ncbi:sigma factor-like helix-turn-helix DNA-binding protein [Sorangium sp. So ce327]|uniref:RNA polymerase sigma factor n=1 Tax=Sorangium sp. So ce327 TaxID=3133301 RepID=UPI003F613797